MQHRSKTSLATQLCKAVNDGEPRTVQILLAQGANPNLVGSKGVAAVHLAVGKETEKSIRCLKLILQHGADPNIRSSDGLTPLHVAALWGCYQNLKLLLKNGGNGNLKDQEGNKPGDLAQQQDNRRCAHLLQEHQSQSLDTEEEDLPQFQYSVYNGQGDASSYAESEDCSVLSHSMSLLSDFGEGPLSSTRLTSFFELSAISNRHSWRRGSHSGASDCKSNPEPPSMLSSTRMSVAGPRAALPVLREDVPLADCSALHPSVTGNRLSPPPLDLLPPCFSRRTSRKSVSFREEVDEYFPVFSSESPRREPGGQGTAYSKDYTLDFSEYSEFLDPERMATVLHHQGIDVTSPEHVFVFSKDNNECTEIDMEKTFVGHFPFEEEDGEVVETQVEEVKVPERALCGSAGSSSSSSGTSRYSSCDSDHYITTLEASPRRVSPSEEERKVKSRGVEDDKHTQNPMNTNNEDLPLTPSPFVTGRTHSRLSRCSVISGKTPESLLSTSSLFEQTLPTPTRTRRQNIKSQGSDNVFYDTPCGRSRTPVFSGNGTGSTSGDSFVIYESQEPQSSTLRADRGQGSYVSASQADTLIIGKDDRADTLISKTMADTVITPSSSSSSYFSPKRDQPPSTPGTTPRYSMSRLSRVHKPQRLASLSYTPGGRPVIPDQEEPVEYLYTDTEQGHELIETHVPPAANTSLSSSMSTSSGEDTVLYDWRSLQGGGGTEAKGKENQEPTKCLTDKELRRRLVEMGESPGPISHRTRPVYMKRLRRLLLEPDTQQQLPDQPRGNVPFSCVNSQSHFMMTSLRLDQRCEGGGLTLLIMQMTFYWSHHPFISHVENEEFLVKPNFFSLFPSKQTTHSRT
ncbi:unnamed protein product, partial [Oncorhynchus mykiss]